MNSELQESVIDKPDSDSDTFFTSKKKSINETGTSSVCSSIVPSELLCQSCHKTYANKSSLNQHKKKCTGSPRFSGQFPCAFCPKRFSHSSSLSRHQKNCEGPSKKTANPPKAKEKDMRKWICAKCDRQLQTRDGLRLHAKKCTGRKLSKATKCIEPSCPVFFYKRTSLIRHMMEDHLQNISVVELTFDTHDKFLEFKRVEDEKYFMSSVKRTGTLRGKKCSYTYYVCNFDARSRPNTHPKILGCKCPARMLVKEGQNGKCFVKYINYHTHKIEVENLKFQQHSSASLERIKTLIKKGVSPQKIRNDLVPSDNQEEYTKKEHFITQKQIRQIRYRLLQKSKIRTDDAEAVETLAQSLEEDSEILPEAESDLPDFEMDGRSKMLERAENLLSKIKLHLQKPSVQKTRLPYSCKVLTRLEKLLDRV